VTEPRIRRIGWSLIALVWIAVGYLMAYYTVLITVGPNRLYRILGQEAYNALIPVGGLSLLALIAVLAISWLAPFLAMFWVSRFALRGLPAQKRVRAAMAIALATTLALPILALDGWPSALLPLVVGDDTEFAPGYSPINFLMIRPGMTVANVTDRLGPPLVRWPPSASGEQIWSWSRSPHGSSYRVRSVIFRGGVVSEAFSEFYVD